MITLDFSLVWKTFGTILYGILILRIAGRKSLSQMTIAQTVVMLAVGTVLIEPLVGTEMTNTFVVVGIAIATLIVIEYAEIRLPKFKKLFTGEPVIIIQDGKFLRDNLKHIRMTIQQVEMELRQASIASVAEVKWGTIEPNGEFGFILKDEFQPVSRSEYRELLTRLERMEQHLSGKAESVSALLNPPDTPAQDDVFKKLLDGKPPSS